MNPPQRAQPTARSKVNIVIVEDHVLFAESLDLALSVEGYAVRRIEVPDSTATTGTVVASLVRTHPHIALLDLDLGGFGDGTRLIGPLTRAGVHVLVITASPDRARWGEALRNGARAVLSKSRPLNEILSTVRRVLRGQPVMTREEREELLRLWHEEREQLEQVHARLASLTAREAQVLGHLMLGRNVHEIAATGVVSEATVRTQVKSILGKLHVSSQLAAVGLAHQAGWRPPPL
jgi:DNA-binding NarL/FixJ family response regulator